MIVGCVGTLVVGTSGGDDLGEVSVDGPHGKYLACSDEPIEKGTRVLVICTHPTKPRVVVVTPWLQ